MVLEDKYKNFISPKIENAQNKNYIYSNFK